MTFNVTQLTNKITVLSYEIPYLQTVAINIIVKVGSRYEDSTEIGISHFLEHMAFKGTKTKSARQIAEMFDSIGGDFNAYTGKEKTVYYTKVLKEHVNFSLEILADILQNSTFLPEEIQKESTVILQEIAQTQDNPDDLAYEQMLSIAYANQALGNSILGNEETIVKFKAENFYDYLAKHYVGENIFISIAGNIKHEKTLSQIKQLFGKIPNKQSIFYSPANYVGGLSRIDKKLEQTTFVIGFSGTSYIDLKAFYSAQMMSLILGGGFSSRLFQRIREELGLVYSVGAYNMSFSDCGIFSIYAGTKKSNLIKLTNNIILEIRKFADMITTKELELSKMQTKANILMAEEKSGYKAEVIGKNYAIFQKYITTNEIIESIMQVSKADIKNVAQMIFSSKPTLSLVGPGGNLVDYDELCYKLKCI